MAVAHVDLADLRGCGVTYTSESRPGVGTEAAESVSQALPKILAASEVLARARRADYALLVTYQRADGRVCRQLYAGNIAAAERKVARCRERGLPASIALVRLVPVVGSVEVGGDAL